MFKCEKDRKEFPTLQAKDQNSFMNTSDLTLKKMFDIPVKLVSEQDEIFKVDTIPLGKTFMERSVIDW